VEWARATWEYDQRPVTLLPVSRQPEVVLCRENGAIWTDIRYGYIRGTMVSIRQAAKAKKNAIGAQIALNGKKYASIIIQIAQITKRVTKSITKRQHGFKTAPNIISRPLII